MAKRRAVTRLGLAYNTYVPALLERDREFVDYVEIPFELLRHDPSTLRVQSLRPIVLHCASMSIAGSVRPRDATVDAIAEWCRRTETPWLGEHLSFITADKTEAGGLADEYAPGEPYNIGYTVSPPMNEESVTQVSCALRECYARFPVPTILENPPVYFRVPGSTMTQVEFINAICDRSDVNLLLDLTHFYITSKTMGFDARDAIGLLPLERVVEAHVSGVELQEGAHWDDHASRAPEDVIDLLTILTDVGRVQAITLEYNWSSRFPRDVLEDEMERVRRAIG